MYLPYCIASHRILLTDSVYLSTLRRTNMKITNPSLLLWLAAAVAPSYVTSTENCTVFVTERVFDGNFATGLDSFGVDYVTDNPILNANKECQKRADDANPRLEGEFKAWLSTGITAFHPQGYSPDENFAKCESYVLPGGDGPAVADTGFPDLTDGTIDNKINELANGDIATPANADLGPQIVWTGTHPNGTQIVGATCDDWTTNNNTGGEVGSSLEADKDWTKYAFKDTECDWTARIYCFQQATRADPQVNGDPHFKTWRGHHFDFHGECDLVLLQSKEFESGLGLDVHIRTHMRRDMSYISSAALRMGKHLLEVQSRGVYYLNGVAGADLPSEFGGFEFLHTRPTDKQHVFEVHLGGRQRIKVKTYKDFVSVSFEQGQGKHFAKSVGLMGDFGTGRMLSRDGKSVIDDANAFGQEWQVLDSEPKLFRTVRFPQHPQVCTMPAPAQASQLRRRLSESSVDELAAEKACEHWGEGKDDCVFDVLSTGDLDMAVAGTY
jgi:hypothetical protein